MKKYKQQLRFGRLYNSNKLLLDKKHPPINKANTDEDEVYIVFSPKDFEDKEFVAGACVMVKNWLRQCLQ